MNVKIFNEHSHLLMLYGRSIKFYKPLNLHYYGSKEEGEEDRQEGSKEEEEGIVPILPQTKDSTLCGVFCFAGISEQDEIRGMGNEMRKTYSYTLTESRG